MTHKSFSSFHEQNKTKLAEQWMTKGEFLLQKKDLSFLECFRSAGETDPSNPTIWIRQAKNLLFYGRKIRSKKYLRFASKMLKIASKLLHSFELFYLWANVFYELGKIEDLSPYFYQAKEKLEKAKHFLKNASQKEKFSFYWLFANIWTHLAEFSNEPIDIRNALDDFRQALIYEKPSHPHFWQDFGNAYLHLGLEINDNSLYLRAIQHFTKVLSLSPNHSTALASMADAFTQLYLSTLDNNYFMQADLAFAKIHHPSYVQLIDWASLLLECGKINKDKKKIRASLNKCYLANHLAPKDPYVIGQMVESLSYLGLYQEKIETIADAENKIIEITELIDDDPDLWYAYGSSLLCFGLYYEDIHYFDLALEKVQLGLDIDSGHEELWQLGGILHTQIALYLDDLRSFRLAAHFFEKAILLKPTCPILYFEYANVLSKAGEITGDLLLLEKSLFYFEESLKTQNNHSQKFLETLFQYAITLDLYGNQKEDENFVLKSIETFLRILLQDPSIDSLHFKLGLAYVHMGELASEFNYFKKSFACFRLATDKNSDEPNFFLEWGLALASYANLLPEFQEERKNYYQEAEEKLIHAGKLGSPHHYYHLSCLYSLNGLIEQAIECLLKAGKLNVLPPTEEMLEDEWLEAVRETEFFSQFLESLQSKES